MDKKSGKTHKQQPTSANLIEEEFVFMLNQLQILVKALQVVVENEMQKGDIGVETSAKTLKAISDVLDRIYKIRHGKAANEEILRKISEIQLHVMKAEQKNAERERRIRENPRLFVSGKLIDEKEISIKEDDLITGLTKSEKEKGVSD